MTSSEGQGDCPGGAGARLEGAGKGSEGAWHGHTTGGRDFARACLIDFAGYHAGKMSAFCNSLYLTLTSRAC